MEEIIQIGQMPGFECENRVYSSEGICPSIKIGGDPKKIIDIERLTWNTDTIASLSRAEQSRAEQHKSAPSNERRIDTNECTRNSRSDLFRITDTKGKSDRTRECITDSDNGEYP